MPCPSYTYIYIDFSLDHLFRADWGNNRNVVRTIPCFQQPSWHLVHQQEESLGRLDCQIGLFNFFLKKDDHFMYHDHENSLLPAIANAANASHRLRMLLQSAGGAQAQTSLADQNSPRFTQPSLMDTSSWRWLFWKSHLLEIVKNTKR